MTTSTHSSQTSAPIAAVVLQIGGAVAIALGLIDFLSVAVPFDFANRGWVIDTTRQLIDRGIVPAMGVSLLFWGFWIEIKSGVSRSWRRGVGVATLAFSALMGLLFLVMAPTHLLSVRAEAQSTLAAITRQSREAEKQIDTPEFKNSLQRQQQVFREQMQFLLQDDARFNEFINSPQFDERQKEFMRRLKANPADLETVIRQRVNDFPLQLLARIRSRRQELETRARTTALRLGVQTGTSGIALSVAYLAIAWLGLGGSGGRPAPRRRRSA
ncbi:MAG: HpsJ family protein [Limnothrix sp.]|uniref:HpsJ family protein n=1 Tax=unclassified Limnothrix TaxID=2632864 RepID=UPI00117B4D09|nr:MULTISPECIES: HpsJ family protein [unclassified Limnothrix]MEB3118253.1 HpsJ family protein [Limnothrix sp.]MBD2161125.1 hypothetical protein [Limnothrix sp. FACHB-1083]MBD2192512.1 hypothetical protein [Limnothrix sp. FACHB-1088]MBD2553244.1 hypothetical protein [Limnothrix sp. FACHB-708]MBD2590732.1 hypothetical protein [Limnothrix sp. FACHB-406]